METHWIENKSDNFSHSFAVHRHTNTMEWPLSTWSSSALSSKCVPRTQMCVYLKDGHRRSSSSQWLCKIKCGKFASHRKNRKKRNVSLYFYIFFVFSLLLCGNGNNKIIMRRWTSRVAVTRRNRLAFAHFLFIPCMHFLFGQRRSAFSLCKPHHFLHRSNSNALSPVKVSIVCCDKMVHGESAPDSHTSPILRIKINKTKMKQMRKKFVAEYRIQIFGTHTKTDVSNGYTAPRIVWALHANERADFVQRWSMLSFRLNTFRYVRRTSDTSTSFSSCFVSSLSVVATFIVARYCCVFLFSSAPRVHCTLCTGMHRSHNGWREKRENSKWEWVENRETKQSVCKWGTIQRNSL